MTFILALATQLAAPAYACAMERMEPVEVVAQAQVAPATLVDVFAEIDAAAVPVQAVEVKRSLNQAKSATSVPTSRVIPEVANPPAVKPAS